MLGGMFTHFANGQSVSTQDNKVLIYDGASDPRSFSAMRAKSLKNLIERPLHPPLGSIKPPKYKEPDEIKSTRKQILAKSSQVKKEGLEIIKSVELTKTSANCKKYKNNNLILSSAVGSFTKPKVEQTAYLYILYFCHEDKKPHEEFFDSIGGIVIVENSRIVANFVYAGSELSQIKALPDINQNGLSEFILAHGYNDIEIAEIVENKVDFFGNIKEVHRRVPGMHEFPSWDYYKKIYVLSGKNPEFFQESYSRKDSDEWKLSKPPEKISLNSSGDWARLFRLVK